MWGQPKELTVVLAVRSVNEENVIRSSSLAYSFFSVFPLSKQLQRNGGKRGRFLSENGEKNDGSEEISGGNFHGM